MVGILAAAALIAAVQGLIVGPPEDVHTADPSAISVAGAVGLKDVLWLDVRGQAVYRESHFPGALHLEEGDWEAGLGRFLERWDPGQPVIVYCDGAGCASSRMVAERLRETLGTESIYWLVDGWPALKGAGLVE